MATMASQSAALETSALQAIARPPADVISCTVSAASCTSAQTTLAPSRAKSRADSRPMPLAAPVMRAILFFKRIEKWVRLAQQRDDFEQEETATTEAQRTKRHNSGRENGLNRRPRRKRSRND